MPSQAAKFVSALFASVLAGIPLATISHSATPAADECLSGPKDQAPAGSHWYYRIDHPTKRHCWYLRGEKLPQSAAVDGTSPAKQVSSNTEAATQRSIADAHAELPMPGATEPPKNGNGLAPATETQPSVVDSRWLEQSETTSSIAPALLAAHSKIAASEEMPSATPAPVPLAAASSPPESQPGSLQTLLLVILGALAFAGLMGSVIFRIGRSGSRATPIDRRAIWDSIDIDRPSPPVEPRARIGRNQMPSNRMPWELRTTDDPTGKVEELLARLARSETH